MWHLAHKLASLVSLSSSAEWDESPRNPGMKNSRDEAQPKKNEKRGSTSIVGIVDLPPTQDVSSSKISPCPSGWKIGKIFFSIVI